MPEPNPGGCQPGEQSFEACLAELQDLVRLLDGGTLGLAESIAGFERGISLLRHCYRTLEQAEQKIEILSGVDQAGKPIIAPFDAASTLETAQEAVARRKKRPPPESAPPESTGSDVPEREKRPQRAAAPEPEPEPEVSLPEEGQLF
jgi:exodeoxyribonuclease VII small subunit